MNALSIAHLRLLSDEKGSIHPDAALFVLLNEIGVLDVEWQRLWRACPDVTDGGPADQAFDRYVDQVWPGYDLAGRNLPRNRDPVRFLLTTPATTLEGIRAKAAAIYAMEKVSAYTGCDRDDYLEILNSFMREVAGDWAIPLGEDAP